MKSEVIVTSSTDSYSIGVSVDTCEHVFIPWNIEAGKKHLLEVKVNCGKYPRDFPKIACINDVSMSDLKVKILVVSRLKSGPATTRDLRDFLDSNGYHFSSGEIARQMNNWFREGVVCRSDVYAVIDQTRPSYCIWALLPNDFKPAEVSGPEFDDEQ